MPKSGFYTADHKLLRYANCWEDADLLLGALCLKRDSKVLSIASAGDNSFSLLSKAPEKLVCIDINPTQLALTSLKAAAFKTLGYEDFLEFLGFTNGKPMTHWSAVKNELDEKTGLFWEDHKELISKGLIYQGKFEKYLLKFQQKLLPLIHYEKTTQQLFALKTTEEQRDFYNKKWNKLRWKLFTRIFFSRSLMGKMGRDPQFLKQVKGNVGEKIKERINQHLSDTAAQENYFLKYMLLGQFGDKLPHYARKENFEPIKANIHKLEFFEGPLEAYPVKAQFTHANLSNIFEYLPERDYLKNINVLNDLLTPGGNLAYWNLMVPRRIANDDARFSSIKNDQSKLKDNGFFYSAFHHDKKKSHA